MKTLLTLFVLLFSFSVFAEINLYSDKKFIGCLDCGRYDSDSICNEYGSYGSKYSSDSVFNEYGTYGSKYSSSSPWNKYSSSDDVPKAIDSQGNFYGYFTINKYRSNSMNISDDLEDIYESANGDLEVVREILCDALS